MHLSKSISIVVSLLLFTSLNIYAQSNSSSLNYSLEFNRGSYDTMQQRAGERGISASDFGQWLADNGQVSIVLKPGQDINSNEADAQLPQQHRLTLFLTGPSGTGKTMSATFTYRGDGGDSVPLGRLISARELDGLLERLLPGGELVNDPPTFFPGLERINSSRELQRIAMDIGRRVSTDDGIVALVLMVTPDADRFEQDVSPGGTAFAAKELDF